MQTAGAKAPNPGLPPGVTHYPFGRPNPSNEEGTTQITIVDPNGNIVVYTSSVETIFGSRHLVAGMVMNNQLTDFAFRPTQQGLPVANRRSTGPTADVVNGAHPGVSPRQTGASPRQPRRPQHPPPAQSCVARFSDLERTTKQAVGLPHLSNRRLALVLESNPPLPWPLPEDQLHNDDQPTRRQPIGSGTALVQWINGQWQGAADPRREGTALALP